MKISVQKIKQFVTSIKPNRLSILFVLLFSLAGITSPSVSAQEEECVLVTGTMPDEPDMSMDEYDDYWRYEQESYDWDENDNSIPDVVEALPPPTEAEKQECLNNAAKAGNQCLDTFNGPGRSMCEFTTSAGVGFLGSKVDKGVGVALSAGSEATQRFVDNPICDFLDKKAAQWCAEQVGKKVERECN